MEDVINIIPPLFFTKLHVAMIGKSTASNVMPSLECIATEWQLDLSHLDDFRMARKILEESVHKN